MDTTFGGDGPVNLTNTNGTKIRRARSTGAGATRSLLAEDSGSLILLNKLTGEIITLPAAAVGVYFDFMVVLTNTSLAYKIITSAGTIFLTGGYTEVDTDSSNAVAARTGNGTTHVSINMNGGTTGGLIGTRLRFTCISATLWMVEGMMQASGAVATAFATS